MNTIEKYLNEVKATGIEVIIPKTMIDQEVKVRLQNLEQRFGSKEKVQEYFKQLGEEKSKEFITGIQTAAQESLEKFFLLNKITELLGIAVDWNNEKEPLSVEKQIYAKLVGELPNAEAGETPKKAPAKKTTKAKKSEE